MSVMFHDRISITIRYHCDIFKIIKYEAAYHIDNIREALIHLGWYQKLPLLFFHMKL